MLGNFFPDYPNKKELFDTYSEKIALSSLEMNKDDN